MLKITLIKYQRLKKQKRKQLKKLKRRNRKKRKRKKQPPQIIIQIVIVIILQVIVLPHHLKVEVRVLGVSLPYAGLNLKDKMLLLMLLR